MAQSPITSFWLARLFAAMILLAPVAASAGPADIEAASRGVVRVVIVEHDGAEVIPVSHGTGFAVSPERIITNAHVVQEAIDDPDLAIGIVPSDGENAVYGRLVSVSPRNDLALLATTSPMNLAPLTISGNPPRDSGSVTSIGYPMNVDRAQGLSITQIFQSQPPVTSTGFLSGSRPTRDFDSLLHTAPIARGNSGGPLVDDCGRVVGVNSFGAESGGADAEFFFAVSTRELLPFLRANDITPQVNGLPCRSLDDLDEQERQRAERERLAREQKAQAQQEALARRSAEARRDIEFAILAERDNRMALSMLLAFIALGAGGYALLANGRGERGQVRIAGGIAVIAILGAGIGWLSRPGFDEVEDRLQELLRAEMNAEDNGVIAPAPQPTDGQYICVLDTQRSRVTSSPTDDLPLEWSDDGCVNGSTQYGLTNGDWTRVFVPGNEAAVSVNRFDPQEGEYRIDRYLLGHAEMANARKARAEYQAPACGGGEDAARSFGARQSAILSLLPEQPNERLVYKCDTVR
ncbi:V8-like Glu-specific endopeptidase [Altererythrobacter atlanticus]|uniref:Serine protease n=1 Tax=Croceibacterium atlanticum TaxID=1267766 RepID=A0A0F7KRX1_9SPHN|nr:trypsin-like peptidase domain-containing protein [Croceibacterium atlanticum]AKH41997.1 Serine protease [Croceibacterium atlanticum]MBB5733435.1 V8-like Glu-specific endopeptidase [Croceibacterium atlanticum]